MSNGDMAKIEDERFLKELDEARKKLASEEDRTVYNAMLEELRRWEQDKNYVPILPSLNSNPTIRALMKEAHQTARSKGWYDADVKPRTLIESLFLMNSEIAEAGEELRNNHAPTEIYVKDGKPEGFPIEIADLLIRVFDTCEAEGIDLPAALAMKMAFNKTRPHRHGGKKLLDAAVSAP